MQYKKGIIRSTSFDDTLTFEEKALVPCSMDAAGALDNERAYIAVRTGGSFEKRTFFLEDTFD